MPGGLAALCVIHDEMAVPHIWDISASVDAVSHGWVLCRSVRNKITWACALMEE